MCIHIYIHICKTRFMHMHMQHNVAKCGNTYLLLQKPLSDCLTQQTEGVKQGCGFPHTCIHFAVTPYETHASPCSTWSFKSVVRNDADMAANLEVAGTQKAPQLARRLLLHALDKPQKQQRRCSAHTRLPPFLPPCLPSCLPPCLPYGPEAERAFHSASVYTYFRLPQGPWLQMLIHT